MRLYVSSAWSERTLARRWMRAATARGFAIALDWTTGPAAITPAQRLAVAERDVKAVEAADALWCLVAGSGSGVGAGVELGLALALRRRVGRPIVVVSGPGLHHVVFAPLADEIHLEHEAAFAALCRRAWR